MHKNSSRSIFFFQKSSAISLKMKSVGPLVPFKATHAEMYLDADSRRGGGGCKAIKPLAILLAKFMTSGRKNIYSGLSVCVFLCRWPRTCTPLRRTRYAPSPRQLNRQMGRIPFRPGFFSSGFYLQQESWNNFYFLSRYPFPVSDPLLLDKSGHPCLALLHLSSEPRFFKVIFSWGRKPLASPGFFRHFRFE